MNNYKKYGIKFTTNSPIHIRGKQFDYGEGFVRLHRKGANLGVEYAYRIDQDVLGEWLFSIAPEDKKDVFVKDYCEYYKEVRPLQYFYDRFQQYLNFDDLIGRYSDQQDPRNNLISIAYNSGMSTITHNDSIYKISNPAKVFKTIRVKNIPLWENYNNRSLTIFLLGNNLIQKLEELSDDDPWSKIFSGRVFIGNGNHFIQSTKKKYYIPGSSIKGAIRTAVLYSILKKIKTSNPNWFSNNIVIPLLGMIHEYQNGKKKKEYFAKELEVLVFKSLFPQEDVRIPKHKLSPKNEQKDIFRFIKVDDIPIPKNRISTNAVIISTLKNSNNLFIKTGPLNLELLELLDKESLQGYIYFDATYFDELKKLFATNNIPIEFPFDSDDPIKSIETILKDFAYDQLNEEKKFFSKIGTLIDAELDTSFNAKPYSTLKYAYYNKDLTGKISLYDINNKEKQIETDKKIILLNTKEIPNEGNIIYTYFIENIILAFTYSYTNLSKSNSRDPFNYNTEVIETFYYNNLPNLRLGWGSQLLGMTFVMLLDPIIKKLLRDEVLLRDSRNLPVPKSKRFVIKNNQLYKPLGWCSLEFNEVKDEY